jgi:hypothetical protein
MFPISPDVLKWLGFLADFLGDPVISHGGTSGGRAQPENASMSDCLRDDELIATGHDCLLVLRF